MKTLQSQMAKGSGWALGGLLAVVVLSLVIFRACRKAPAAPMLALEECDPAGYMPCLRQNAFASIPVIDTGVYLTYSSRWVHGRSSQHIWDAQALGLGGWSINLVQSYDKTRKLFVSGDGSWRLTDCVVLPSDEVAVPSYDGAVAYIFDSAGRHVRTLDGHLSTELVRISYDSAGRFAGLDGFIAGKPVHVSVRRDSLGRAKSLVGIDGEKTTLDLDSQSHLVGITDPADQTTRISWNPSGMLESQTDPAGGVARFTYDPSGRLATLTDPDGVIQRFNYDESSKALEIRASTPQGRHWSYRSESTKDGIRRMFVARDGTAITDTLDWHGNRELKLANDTSYSFRVLPNPVWGMAAPIFTPLVKTRPDGVTSRREIEYDLQPQGGLPYALAGSLIMTINSRPWIESFDPAQRTKILTDPVGRRTTCTYDAQNRMVKFAAPGAAPVSYTYDAYGRLAIETIGTGKLARMRRFAYNRNTGETIITRPDGVIEKVTTDRAGRVVSTTAGDGSTTLANYNSAGRLIQIQPPGGMNFTAGISSAGRPTAFAPPMLGGEGSVETTMYDPDGRLAAISGLGDRAVNFVYDSMGRISNWTFDRGRAAVSYDVHSGLATQGSDPSGVVTSYGYVGGNLKRLAWSGPVGGSVSTMLDADGRAVSENVNGTGDLDFSYDASGDLSGVGPLQMTRDATSGLVTHTALGAVETNQEFDGNAQISRSTTTVAGKVVLDQRYTRDVLDRIKTVTDTGKDGGVSKTEYSYDRGGRLVSVRVNGRLFETDGYDSAGNRISVIRTSRRLSAKYDMRQRLVNWGGARTYLWTPKGNLAREVESSGTTSFAYDDFGSLREVTLENGRAIKYLVDVQGRRVGRKVDGKLVAGYLYKPDGSIAAAVDSAGTITARFGYDDLGRLAVLERRGMIYRVITDLIGTPRLIVDSRTGRIVDEITSDAWGNVTHETKPGFIPIGFAGGLRDFDTGLIRFGARDYDPETGRFTGPDPIRFASGQTNLYAYLDDNPANGRDPSGLDGGVTVSFSGIFGVGLTYGVTIEPTNGGDLDWHITGGVGVGVNGGVNVQFNNSNTAGQGWSGSTGGAAGVAGIDGDGEPSLGWSPIPGFSHTWTRDLSKDLSNWYDQHVVPEEDLPADGPDASIPTDNAGSSGASGNGQSDSGNGGSGQDAGPGKNNPDSGDGGPNPGNGPGNNGPDSGGGRDSGAHPGDGGTAGGNGEPHLYTVAGFHFDLQAAGEFVAASSPDKSIVIQARQEQWGSRPVAIDTGIAANINGDRLSVYTKEPAFLIINGLPAIETDLERHLPHGGTVVRHSGFVKTTWPDGSELKIIRDGDLLNYSYYPSSKVAPSVRGLLGGSEDSKHDLMGRDGVGLSRSDPDFQSKLYLQFANSWRIKQSDSLFHYWPGESTATFTDLNMPVKPVTAATLSSEAHSRAETVCRAFGVRIQPALDDCILDVGLTGMPAFVTASVEVAATLAHSRARGAPISSAPSTAMSAAGTSQFVIKIGYTVSPDHPTPGAGTLVRAGERQSYAFVGKAGESIFVAGGACDGALLTFEVREPDGGQVGAGSGCSGFGPLLLKASGTYQLVARAVGPAAHYSFTLRAVPSDQYSIRLGDTVGPDRLPRGAGIIAQPGQKQTYSFAGKAGQVIYIALGPCQGAQPSFDLLQPDNTLLANIIGNCTVDLGRQRLPVSGTYRIVAGTDVHNYASHYSFRLLTMPPDQHFAVRLPLTVQPDSPEHGAGRISIPGEEQFFDFTASPGATLHIEGKCGGKCDRLDIRAASEADEGNNGYWGLNYTDRDWTLPPGGRFTIEVQSKGYVGSYSFVARLK